VFVPLAIYTMFALFIGFFGRERYIGFAGWFLIAMVTTPPIAALCLLVSSPAAGAR
jgi:hypothetical protein